MMRICYVFVALLLASCGGTSNSMPHPTHVVLTLRASVNGGTPINVTSPYALNLPNVGDAGIVTAYEGTQQTSFTLVPSTPCTNIVAISPGTTATQQTVTAVQNGGQCTATAQTADGNATTLTIFALPPPV
jgi:hypothetical protein